MGPGPITSIKSATAAASSRWPGDPGAGDVCRLLERHLEFAYSHSPPEDDHALDAGDFLDPPVTLFGFRRYEELLAVGALKQFDGRHAELKSMHTALAARGRGIGRAPGAALGSDS